MNRPAIRKVIRPSACAAVVALAAALAPPAARAAEPERVVVRNRKYSVGGRVELSAMAGFTLVNYLTDHTNFSGALTYNVAETLALEVGGGWALSRHTNVADTAANEVVRTDPNTAQKVANDFEDLWQVTWNVQAVLRWAPIYGKINLLSEVPVHFQFYLLAGGGAGGMIRDSVIYCVGSPDVRKQAQCVTNPTSDVAGTPNAMTPLHEQKTKPIFVGGLGMRFFVVGSLGLRVEVRDMSFPDSFLVDINRASAESDPSGAEGSAAANPGFTHLMFVQVGATYTF